MKSSQVLHVSGFGCNGRQASPKYFSNRSTPNTIISTLTSEIMSSQEEFIRCAILCRPVIETDSSISELLPIHPNGSNFSLQLGEEHITPHSLYANGAIPIENLGKSSFSLFIQLYFLKPPTDKPTPTLPHCS